MVKYVPAYIKGTLKKRTSEGLIKWYICDTFVVVVVLLLLLFVCFGAGGGGGGRLFVCLFFGFFCFFWGGGGCCCFLFVCFLLLFSDFPYKSMCCGFSFELHRQVDAIQMGTHNICLSKEVGKKYTGCNLKTTVLLGCALIGVCAVIRSKTVPNKTKSAIFVYLMSFLLPTDSYFIPQQRNRANF